MRDLTLLDSRFKLNPQLVILINWEEPLFYAMDEMTVKSDFPTYGDDPIYGYVKEFSDLTMVSHAEGFGQVSSVNLTMIDAFGHFKAMFESHVIYNITATLYIRTRDNDTMEELFSGKLDDIEWRQSDKEFSFSVISKGLKGTVGYTPVIADIAAGGQHDFYEKFLNSEAWPLIFGTVKGMEGIPLNTLTDVVKVREVINEEGESEDYVIVGDLANQISPAPAITFPIDVPVNIDMRGLYDPTTVVGYMFTERFILPVTGSFTEADDEYFFSITAISDKLWSGVIYVTFYEGVGQGPLTIQENPGFPLKGHKIQIITNTESGSFAIQETVLRQSGDNGWEELHLSASAVHTIFDTIDGPSYMNLIYNRPPGTVNFKIPKDTQFYFETESNYEIYIVDTKESATVDRVYIKTARGEEEDLNEVVLVEEDGEDVKVGDYEVKTTTIDVITGEQEHFWNPSGDPHPSCTYIEMGRSSFFKYFLDFIAKTDTKQGILVDIHDDSYNTETEVLTYLASLLGLTTVFHSVKDELGVPIDVTDRTVSWVVDDEEDLPSLISEIAWQGLKAVRPTGTNLDVFDLNLLSPQTDEPLGLPIVDPIDLSQIQYNQFKVMPTPFSEIVTKLTINYLFNDVLDEVKLTIFRNNEDLYDTQEDEVDVYIYDSLANIITVGNYWIGRYSDPEYLIELTGSLDLMKYEVWDKLNITTPVHSFAKESPLDESHTVSDSNWAITPVVVKEVSVNFNDMSVTLILRSSNIVGTL